MLFVYIWEPQIYAWFLKRHSVILPLPRMLVTLKLFSKTLRIASPGLSEMSFSSTLQTGDTIALAPWHHQPPSVLSSSPWSIGNAPIAYPGSVICSILHWQSRNRSWRIKSKMSFKEGGEGTLKGYKIKTNSLPDSPHPAASKQLPLRFQASPSLSSSHHFTYISLSR